MVIAGSRTAGGDRKGSCVDHPGYEAVFVLRRLEILAEIVVLVAIVEVPVR
jgi:hypothetical protein